MKKLFAFISVITSCCLSFAAPYPGTATSALVAPEKGLFFAAKGFNLNSSNTGWTLAEDVRFESPTQRDAALSVKVENLSLPTTLEIYTKKWIKEYISYGFDILGNKAFTQNEAKGLVIDLKHNKKSKHIRQVIFVKDQTAVILTCVSPTKEFTAALKGCNDIIKSFAWIRSETNL